MEYEGKRPKTFNQGPIFIVTYCDRALHQLKLNLSVFVSLFNFALFSERNTEQNPVSDNLNKSQNFCFYFENNKPLKSKNVKGFRALSVYIL